MTRWVDTFVLIGAAWGVMAFIRTHVLQSAINDLRKEVALLKKIVKPEPTEETK